MGGSRQGAGDDWIVVGVILGDCVSWCDVVA
jgi:hypothetical protein